MRSFLDAKAMATTLRQELKSRKLDLSHSECLEVVAKQFGFRDWNTMVAQSVGNPAPSSPELAPLPNGWDISGRITNIYSYGILPKGGPAGEPALFVGARPELSEKIGRTDIVFCAIQQRVKATNFKGKRVAFGLQLCGENIADRAFPFLSILDENARFLRTMDHWLLPAHMVIEGTSDWRHAEIVMDVPDKAQTIEFGVMLNGFSGHVLASNLSFGESVAPLTPLRSSTHESPQNLDLRLR